MISAPSEDIAKKAAKILLDTKSVLFNSREPFVFTSGRISPVYTDCRRLKPWATPCSRRKTP